MGCSNGRTKDQNGKSKKLLFPKNTLTFDCGKEINSMALLDCSRLLLGVDKEIKIGDLSSKSPTSLYNKHNGRVNVLTKLSSDLYASGSEDKTIKLWNVNQSTSGATFTGHTSIIWCLTECIAEGGIASGADDKTLRLWNIKEKKEEGIGYTGKALVMSVGYLKCGLLVSGSGDSTLRVWNVKEKKMTKEVKTGADIWCGIQLKDERICAGDGNGDIQVWDKDLTKIEMTLKGHKRTVNCGLDIGNGRIVSSSDEPDMIMWNLNDSGSKYILKGHNDNVMSGIKIDDGRFASGSKDKTVKIWE